MCSCLACETCGARRPVSRVFRCGICCANALIIAAGLPPRGVGQGEAADPEAAVGQGEAAVGQGEAAVGQGEAADLVEEAGLSSLQMVRTLTSMGEALQRTPPPIARRGERNCRRG